MIMLSHYTEFVDQLGVQVVPISRDVSMWRIFSCCHHQDQHIINQKAFITNVSTSRLFPLATIRFPSQMARILITGSSDGIGAVAARKLVQQGHSVILHARNESRAEDAKKNCPGAEDCLIGDLSSIPETKQLAENANKKYGSLDAVVHNAGVWNRDQEPRNDDGLSSTFVVNSLAPFILTSLMDKPKRVIYVSSKLHDNGDESLKDVGWQMRHKVNGFQAYSDTKLHNAILSAAVARYWPDVKSTSLDPGWVPTKLGSYRAPGDIQMSGDAIIWLATDGGESGQHYSQSQQLKSAHRAVSNVEKQDKLLQIYEDMAGIQFPR